MIKRTVLPSLLVAFTAAAVPAEAGEVDALAAETLTRMASTIEGAEQLSFHAWIDYDVIQPTGQRLEYHVSRGVALRRPDRLLGDVIRDGKHRQIWFNDGRLVVMEKDSGEWGEVSGPKTIDGMLDHAIRDHGVSIPLADFLYADVDKGILESALSGRYVGVTDVEGRTCHHLAFQHPDADWQIWIEAGDRPVPRKLAITYKNDPGAPQFTASWRQWDLSPSLPDWLFEFEAPESATRLDVRPIEFPAPPRGRKQR